jgi:glycosyltransferase 2 family protein
VEAALGQGLQGIRSFHDRDRLTRFLFLTVGIWCLDMVTATVSAHAIGLSIGVRETFLLLAGLGLGSALPSTPGYVGIYQFVAVTVLAPFGVSKTNAIAYIVLLQAIIYLVILTWGLIGLGQQRKMGGSALQEPLSPDATLRH